ncbi:MAG: CRISPR-associated protein Cas4 [Desulfobacterales bacterium]|nr:CRISPR-associated protein Cas4 [Desulfobacterales bacterium]
MSILITPSEIIEYLYCPRFSYFMFCLGIDQHEDKRFKVQKGREIHKEKSQINKDYLRKKIGVINKEVEVYLASEKFHLKGIVDEVLTLNDGTMSPLDYKFAEYKEKEFKTYKIQSLIYGILISENYNKAVHKGFIVYTRSKNKLLEIEFVQKDFDDLAQTIQKILYIIQKGYYPKKTSSKSKCDDCTFNNICV